jgi:Biotin-protein ligase, N terminal
VIRVALYADEGTEPETTAIFERLFRRFDCGELIPLRAARFTTEELQTMDLVILPSGRGSRICGALGDAGKESLLRYVRDGGDVVGVCAGAYALSARYAWSLKLLPVQVLDTPHWARGVGPVAIRMTSAGQELFGTAAAVVRVYFHNGPVVAPFPDGAAERYTILARFEEELVHPDGVRGLMVGSPAALSGAYGRGRAVAISPHLEETEGHEELFANAVRYLTATRCRAA